MSKRSRSESEKFLYDENPSDENPGDENHGDETWRAATVEPAAKLLEMTASLAQLQAEIERLKRSIVPTSAPTPLLASSAVSTPTARAPIAPLVLSTPVRTRSVAQCDFPDFGPDLDGGSPAESDPPAYIPEPPHSVDEVPLAQCDGIFCRDLDCVLSMQRPGEVDPVKWFDDHGFTLRGCPVHGGTNINKAGVCRVPVAGKGGYCRKRCLHEQDPRLFAILHMLSHFAPINVIAEATKTCRNVVGRLVKKVAQAALWAQSNRRPRFEVMSVDETCVGKRKNNVGKRSRAANYWFFTATQVLPNGAAGLTTWHATPHRRMEAAEAFVGSVLAGGRCTVYTDAAKCYHNLGRLVRTHGVVNHTTGFINDRGEHTNHAEGAHGVVKDIVRAIWTTFGQSGELVEERAALGAYLFNKGAGCVTRRKKNRARLQALLQLVKQSGSCIPNYVFAEEGTAPMEGEEDEDDVGSGTEQEEEGEEEGSEEEEESDPLLLRQTRAQRVLSLRQGNRVSLDVIRVMFAHHEIPLVTDMGPEARKVADGNEEFAVVMHHGGHFVLGIARQQHLTFSVYDSRRYFLKEERDATCGMVIKWLREVWSTKRHIKKVMKEAGVVQQPPEEENDSALYVINHAILVSTKTLGKYDRKGVRAIVSKV